MSNIYVNESDEQTRSFYVDSVSGPCERWEYLLTSHWIRAQI